MDPKEQAAVGYVKLMMASHHIYRAARRLLFAEANMEEGWPSDDLAQRRDDLAAALAEYRATAREFGGDRFGEGDLP